MTGMTGVIVEGLLEGIGFVWARLALAALCIGVLMWARWNHERQQVDEARPWLEEGELEAREARTGFRLWKQADQRSLGGVGLPRRSRPLRLPAHLPALSHPLYWLGLTTSAALAGQAIAALIAGNW